MLALGLQMNLISQIAAGGVDGPVSSIKWQSKDNSLWYVTTFDTQTVNGEQVTIATTAQDPSDAGSTPYLIFTLNDESYKVQLSTDLGVTDIYIHPDPVDLPGRETKAVLDQNGDEKSMYLIDDNGQPILRIA